MNQIIALCFYAGISLLAFGAVYMPSVLGYFAASPGIPLLFVAGSLAACRTLLAKRPDGLSRDTLLLVFSGIPLSIIGFFWYGVDARLLGKFCTLLILCFVWLSPLVCSSARLYRSHNLKLILSLGLGISVVALVLSDYLQVLPQIVRNLVFSEAFQTPVDARPRGFMEEASHFAAYGGVCLLNLFLLRERGRLFSLTRFLSFSLILIGYLFAIGSKGSIIGVAIALLAIGMSWRRLHYLLLALPGFYVLALSQVQVLSADISQYTSVATRLGMGGAAVLGIAHNPFGYGYYGFYGAFANFGMDVMELLGSYLPLNLSEFADIMSSMQNISAKSTLLDFTLIFGVFFVYFLWRTLRRMDLADTRVRFSLTYVFLVFLSNSGHLSLMFFLSLAVLVHNYPRAEKKPLAGRADDGQALETPAPL